MGHLKVFLFVAAALLIFNYVSASWSAGSCPPRHKVDTKTPCYTDADCLKYGKICCPNERNTKSCSSRAPYVLHNNNNRNAAGGSGYKQKDCNGVKCMPWQVCKNQRCQNH